MVLFRPGLLSKAVFRSVALPQPESVLMSIAPIALRAMLMIGVRPLSRDMLVSEGHTAVGALSNLVDYFVTWGHSIDQVRASTEGHVWVRDAAAAS